MSITIPSPIQLVGLDLNRRTTNTNAQSSEDCGALWQKFEQEVASKIKGRLSDKVFAVYYDYDPNDPAAFRYFVGSEAPTEPNPELDHLMIPPGSYQKVVAKGKMPECMTTAWKEVWESKHSRQYTFDFEVYDSRSQDWSNAEVDIFIS
ncbi:GyrI-like domain-containing protein [Marinoscillum furvescens]|uniref:Putative transcriptional regulator YdeE n=1 Tax=Marinoscillum furvescens DSM 4134 TaxID=1122208 RepID=A0A3D9LG54_MARFU|nr:effector binding domain-containing protein [Marinoscillum furvescens]REE05660.1 putative transcriptional regulator YdeE [Marinoscillum furvescens DSM 4134]